MRTQEEIDRQIDGLEKMKESLPKINYFGENNWIPIDAQIDIPEDIIDYWSKYWKGASDSLHQYNYDMEPRLWGNDCFEGEMSSWF